MKIKQNMLHKLFLVEYAGEEYVVDYLNSNYDCLELLHRDYWEVWLNQKEIEDDELRSKLIHFCQEHFYDYDQKLKLKL